MTDARDAEQLSKNKVTHILSVHDSARPMLEVRVLICVPICAVLLGARGRGGGWSGSVCSAAAPILAAQSLCLAMPVPGPLAGLARQGGRCSHHPPVVSLP